MLPPQQSVFLDCVVAVAATGRVLVVSSPARAKTHTTESRRACCIAPTQATPDRGVQSSKGGRADASGIGRDAGGEPGQDVWDRGGREQPGGSDQAGQRGHFSDGQHRCVDQQRRVLGKIPGTPFPCSLASFPSLPPPPIPLPHLPSSRRGLLPAQGDPNGMLPETAVGPSQVKAKPSTLSFSSIVYKSQAMPER